VHTFNINYPSVLLERWFTHLDVFIKFPCRIAESPNRRFEEAARAPCGRIAVKSFKQAAQELIFQSAPLIREISPTAAAVVRKQKQFHAR
jgi:hypothetical protein